jgi:hypothetical protein
MNPAFPNSRIYGHRARIGYTSPPLTTEIFPYEFYKIVPDGVTLVVTTLAIVERSKSEVEQSYAISMKAARAMAAAGVDIVVLGGVPINLSRGAEQAERMTSELAAELGVKVSTSASAQARSSAAKRRSSSSPIRRARRIESPVTAGISDAKFWVPPRGGAPSINSVAFRYTPHWKWRVHSCASIPLPTRFCCLLRTGR